MRGPRKTAVVTALAVAAAVLVPASSYAATSEEFAGGTGSEIAAEDDLTHQEEDLVEEEDEEVLVEEAEVTGKLLADDSALLATEYQGNRVTISALEAGTLSWTDLASDQFTATDALVETGSAHGSRAASATKGANYVALVNNDGFSVLVELLSRESDREYAFDVGVPEGAMLILTDEGSVDVLGNDRYTIGSFETPWALDAEGREIPTRFEVEAKTITQIIETDENTVYPVVADPRYTWGWVTGTVYFNKWETLILCSGTLNTLRWLVTLPFWIPVVLAVASIIVLYSCAARLLDKCVKVKSTGAVIIYSGGYCR
ncbi:MAG: hypothetical protein F4Y27_08205 [Acidimicrobiaceae bacterium]|nr:hypothetical protein [Acidimicrobiaceae bacterium]MXW62417.1 hypothetical protein [Acidimicrobiaceae bacterium]MXW76445.1 hypothetical protein [Acidimicrobiaceae bacterium]MYA74643.1 hypothetical protein [Acidimicrobiaceae bacterium]MYC41447.1 hypothetical protein [Acidimicrobiaceae bacterium]